MSACMERAKRHSKVLPPLAESWGDDTDGCAVLGTDYGPRTGYEAPRTQRGRDHNCRYSTTVKPSWR
jgi:hypothetical protein